MSTRQTKYYDKLFILRITFSLVIYFLLSFFVFSSSVMSGTGSVGQISEPKVRLEGIKLGLHHPFSVLELESNPTDDILLHPMVGDTADVAVEYTAAYPGNKDFLVTIYLKNPVSLAGFDFEIIITPPDLADFSTVRVYADSMDTCTEPELTCWYRFPVRECLIVPGPEMEDWGFAAHGAHGDTTQPLCDTVWMLGLTIFGPYIPPHLNYVPLLQFGVDVSCVSDSLMERNVTFNLTGHLSDTEGQLVPFRVYPGKLTIWVSVPGDASSDSLVDLSDIVFLINYLYKGGSVPCVMEAADANADCQVDLGDVVYLIGFLYRQGPPPVPGCAH